MGLIGTIVIGLLVGAFAKLLIPGQSARGWPVALVLGLAGSFGAAFLGRNLGWYRDGQTAAFIASVAGAIFLLAIYHFVAKSRLP